MSDFLKRFASVPDILELDHLTVSGNVTFGRGASLKGTVIIIANHGDQVRVLLWMMPFLEEHFPCFQTLSSCYGTVVEHMLFNLEVTISNTVRT